jgi:GTP1/Obg family GTP-binding protein
LRQALKSILVIAAELIAEKLSTVAREAQPRKAQEDPAQSELKEAQDDLKKVIYQLGVNQATIVAEFQEFYREFHEFKSVMTDDFSELDALEEELDPDKLH